MLCVTYKTILLKPYVCFFLFFFVVVVLVFSVIWFLEFTVILKDRSSVVLLMRYFKLVGSLPETVPYTDSWEVFILMHPDVWEKCYRSVYTLSCATTGFRCALPNALRNLRDFLRFGVGLCFETLLILCPLRSSTAGIVLGYHINLLQSRK